MSSPKRQPHDGQGRSPSRSLVESLESRRLLSAATAGVCGSVTACDDASASIVVKPSINPAGTVAGGFTPTQIRHAYHFDQVVGDGTGQTIAIVDAFNDPKIVSDLATFDARFNLPAPPSFNVVNQSGGPVTSLHTDGAWASEVALDVEWAHAIAPGASLLLVESNTDTIPDLMAGVDYARNVPGVSVVALSWGGSEFRGQSKYDAMLGTPANHTGVTFVAAAGDVGSSHGPNWPASSPSVVSVGGTSLFIKTADGTYSTEVGWRNTTGGASRYERRPAYQSQISPVGSTRLVPDVAYDADPNTGFVIYSSVNDAGVVGWSSVAGTSAGVPQWAGAIAIANQLRSDSGLGALDGSGQTLPDLYKQYSPPGTAGYGTYTANFTDITQGRTSSSRIRAGLGYDQATGLGTPKAPGIVAALSAPM